jgi:hypothetical protein
MYGDTAVGRRRVAQLRERADDIRGLAERLVAQAESVPWHGRAAEAMRTRIKERASHLRAAAEQHELAAETLARHVGAVSEVKGLIDERETKGTRLIEEAQTRNAGIEADPAAGEAGDDATLTAFSAPPSGHKDWLSVELPGL